MDDWKMSLGRKSQRMIFLILPEVCEKNLLAQVCIWNVPKPMKSDLDNEVTNQRLCFHFQGQVFKGFNLIHVLFKSAKNYSFATNLTRPGGTFLKAPGTYFIR